MAKKSEKMVSAGRNAPVQSGCFKSNRKGASTIGGHSVRHHSKKLLKRSLAEFVAEHICRFKCDQDRVTTNPYAQRGEKILPSGNFGVTYP